jgi:hypothetical protein
MNGAHLDRGTDYLSPEPYGMTLQLPLLVQRLNPGKVTSQGVILYFQQG